MPRDFAELGRDGGSAGTQIFSEQIVMCVGQKICRCGFFNVAIYPEDWEGSNNYLEGWNLLTASMDYNIPSPYLWAERHSPNPFPSRPKNLLLLLSFTSCDWRENLKESAAKGQSVFYSCNKEYCLEKFKQMEIERPFYVSVSLSVTISSSTEMLLTQVVNKMSQRAFLPFIHKTPA